MSNICSYNLNPQIFSSKQRWIKKEILEDFHNRACFSDLQSYKDCINSVIFIPFLPKHNFKIKTAIWFLGELKKWGFEFEEVPLDKLNKFKKLGRQFTALKVNYTNYRKTLSTLVALRYLDNSENLFHIVNDTYLWSIKFPQVDTFLLFQLAHYTYKKKYKFNFNWNHTFLNHKPVCKLCSLKRFWKEIDNLQDGGIESIMAQDGLSAEEQLKMIKLIDEENFEELTNDFLSN